MCGNGIRCVAKLVIDHGLAPGPILRIATDDGLKTCWCELADGKVVRVRVDVGIPTLEAARVPVLVDADRAIDHPVRIAGQPWRITAVGLGNPHAVVFVDDLDAVDLARVGPEFERDPIFPQRVNAHFVRVDSPDHVTMKTWERGSGVTRACGTGASAVCVASAITARTGRRITASLPGGDLELEWAADDHVYKTGPAVEVFQGDWPG
jgi:diaminopimelate epimerase